MRAPRYRRGAESLTRSMRGCRNDLLRAIAKRPGAFVKRVSTGRGSGETGGAWGDTRAAQADEQPELLTRLERLT